MTTAEAETNAGTAGQEESQTQSDTQPQAGIGAAAERVRQNASDAYEAARQKTASLYGSTRESAARAGRRTADEIDANPIAAVAGGLALGAIVAALLPRTRREQEVLGPLGSRITETAREAANAARDAGRGKLDELGLNREGARQKLGELASSAGEAIRQAGSSRRES
ncbi:MAG: hypothetical protein JWN69_406 [Alphaproteobacteria bacterium]|nr:hypothetical protein [Alphaproteobacteria bacterium]